jgi:hypothetical protein
VGEHLLASWAAGRSSLLPAVQDADARGEVA